MYDTISPVAALPIATCLRVLLHDTATSGTGTSHALLQQLGLLDSLQFRDTSLHIDPRNLIRAHNGLVVMRIVAGVGGSYAPRFQAQAEQANPDLSFRNWWSTVVLRDHSDHRWTRKDLVLAMANKEGGAHLDPAQPESIHALEERNSMGWIYIDADGERPFQSSPLAPSIRQLARETILTLSDDD